MLETEIAFAELEDILVLAEALLCFIMTRVLDQSAGGADHPGARPCPVGGYPGPLSPLVLHRGSGSSHGRRLSG